MTDSTRFVLLLLSGLLLFAGVTVAVLDDTAPMPVAAAESPILQVAPTTTTTTEPPTTAPPETTTTTAAPAREPVERLAGGAVAPPRNSYAPEPIVEFGRIEIPKIGLDHKTWHGITLRNIDNGPSHWPGTAMPGEVGNTVFAGHRVTHSHPFRRIDELQPGDEIFFTVNGVRSRYVVTGHEVVSPSRVDIVNPTPTATATLFACHPPGSARQRYVVRAAYAPLDGAGAPAPAPAPDAGSAPGEGAPQA
jgi:sortase A